jgi:Helix-turn-helix domain
MKVKAVSNEALLLLIAEVSDRLRVVEAAQEASVPETPDGPGWVRIKQAAAITGFSRQAIHRWIQKGEVLARRRGGGPWRVNLESVRARASVDILHLCQAKRVS